MRSMSANRRAPDVTPRFAASHLGLFCLPMSRKKDARRIWVNLNDGCLWPVVQRIVNTYSCIFNIIKLGTRHKKTY